MSRDHYQSLKPPASATPPHLGFAALPGGPFHLPRLRHSDAEKNRTPRQICRPGLRRGSVAIGISHGWENGGLMGIRTIASWPATRSRSAEAAGKPPSPSSPERFREIPVSESVILSDQTRGLPTITSTEPRSIAITFFKWADDLKSPNAHPEITETPPLAANEIFPADPTDRRFLCRREVHVFLVARSHLRR